VEGYGIHIRLVEEIGEVAQNEWFPNEYKVAKKSPALLGTFYFLRFS